LINLKEKQSKKKTGKQKKEGKVFLKKRLK